MNIWIEGVDGTGKTTLARALGEALGVEPLYHVTHEELPDRPYNVIDRHAAITNEVYKQALPSRFKAWPKIEASPRASSDDLYILLRPNFLRYYPSTPRKGQDYTDSELDKLDCLYAQLLPLAGYAAGKLVTIQTDYEAVVLYDYTAYPDLIRQTRISNGCELPLQESIEVKVREILKIVREMEWRNRVAN